MPRTIVCCMLSGISRLDFTELNCIDAVTCTMLIDSAWLLSSGYALTLAYDCCPIKNFYLKAQNMSTRVII